MLSVFAAPGRYVQGRDATRSLGAEIARLDLGSTVLIVAGRSAHNLLRDTWKKTFAAARLQYSVYEFGGECTRAEIEKAKKAASELGAQVIVGAGGGKVLDTSRAVAAELNLATVNCPTTASSDAPCSALSVVYNESGEFEDYLFFKRHPQLVLVDASVIAKAPSRLLSAGMGDALATWFEAKTVFEARRNNQLGGGTTISALALARLSYETLLDDGPAALEANKRGVVSPALERVIEANTLLSGLGFESGGLAVAHSVHNGLTTVADTHSYMHGEKVAFGLITQLVLEGKSSDLIHEVMSFCQEVGLPVHLGELGISELTPHKLDTISGRASAPGETCHNEPFEITPRLLSDAIVAADAMGKAFAGEFIFETADCLSR